jgi:hypothetical protein
MRNCVAHFRNPGKLYEM